jgi:hypothetical protein
MPRKLPRKGFGSALGASLWELGTPTTDSDYQKRHGEAAGPTEKGRILTEYSAAYPKLFSRSAWVKTALADAPHLQGNFARSDDSTPWYESSPDVLRRRQIVLKNPGFSAKSYCKVFDGHSIPLVGGWEKEFGVSTWAEAYENKTARARIQTIISKDKKAQ